MSPMTLFDAAKSVDALEFCRIHLHIEFKRVGNATKAASPFRPDERTPSFGYMASRGLFKDFGGDFKGSIVDLVMAMKNMEKAEAAKWICEKWGVEYAKNEKEYSAPKKSLAELFAEQRAFLLKHFKSLWPHLTKIFPDAQRVVENEELFQYLGWDEYHHTLTVANIVDGAVANIRWRTKKNNTGKWIGASDAQGAKTLPFPDIPNFENYVVLVEGEKDALSLHAIGVYALTMGGAGNSFAKAGDRIGTKKVYIFFDYDAAGASNVLPKAKEAYEAGAGEVFWVDLRSIVPASRLFQKMDASDFLSLYPLQNAEEFFARIAANASYIPKSKVTPSVFETSLLILDNIVKPTTIDMSDYPSGLPEFESKLFALIEPYDKGVLGVVENQKKLLAGVLEDRTDAKLVAGVTKHIAQMSAALSVEKRMNIAGYIKSECVRLGLHIFKESGQIFYFNKKYFAPWDRDSFYHFYANTLHTKAAQMSNRKGVEELYDSLLTVLDFLPQAANRLVINLQNCVLDLDIKKKKEHSHKYGFKYALNFEYNLDADCPLFDRFLDSSLPDKTVQDVVMEFLAYSLMPGHKYQKFLLLTGQGSNGKSVLMEIMEAFFSPDSVGLSNYFEGFATSELVGKKINFAKDKTLRGMSSEEMDSIKKIVDGSGFAIAQKFKDSVHLTNPPKLVISTNKLPGGVDPAFTRRMLLIPFEQKFEKNHADEKYKIDYDLARKIISTELPGIFNKVLAAMGRLLKHGFSESDKLANAVKEFALDANPVYRFCAEMMVREENAPITTVDSFYIAYQEWAKAEGVQAKSKTNFGKDVKEFLSVESVPTKMSGQTVRVYPNYRLRAAVAAHDDFEADMKI